MSGSSTKVNYNIRTSKSIERSMMCEIIACLEHVTRVSDYRYVGLGAKYFADFVLMHKRFGITELYSLETCRSEKEKSRFEFNKPYNCINIDFKSTTEWLNSNSYGWKKKNDIIWFDYDDPISNRQINDISTCIKKLKSGSMLFMSTNISATQELGALNPDERLQRFQQLINQEDLVKHVKKKDITGKNKIIMEIANIINLSIINELAECNKAITNESKKMHVDQVAFFTYVDSITPMMTLGWIVYNEYDKDEISKCGFESLEFYRASGSEPYNISVPNFTYKELAVLNKNMPEANYPIEEAEFLSIDEIEAYKKIYRYYPTTMETGIVL